MTNLRKFTLNTIVQIFGSALNILSILIITSLLSRYLGSDGYGKYCFIFAFIAIISSLSDLGLEMMITRELTQNEDHSGTILGNMIILKGLLSFTVVFCVFLSYQFFEILKPYKMALIIVSFIPVLDVFRVLDLLFRARLKMTYSVIAKIISNILSIMLIYILVVSKQTLTMIIAATPIVLSINYFILFLFSRRFTQLNFVIDMGLWKRLIKDAIPFGIIGILYVVLWRSDTVLLALFQNDSAVGIYSIARKFIDASLVVPTAVIISVFPIISVFYWKNKTKVQHIFQKTFTYLLAIGFFILIFFCTTASQLVHIVAGDEFKGSVEALKLLSLTIPPYFLVSLTGIVLVAANKHSIAIFYGFLGTALNIILNLILIPKYSYMGASFSTVVAFTLQAFLSVYYTKKYTGLTISLQKMIHLCIIVAVIVVIYQVLFQWGTPAIPNAVVSMAVFLMLIHFTRVTPFTEFIELINTKKNDE